MAYKVFGSNDPETKKIWSDMVEKRLGLKTQFKDGDTSTSAGQAVILTKTDLDKVNARGDRIRVISTDNLNGEGRVGDEVIVGHGEAIRSSTVDVTIDQVRHETESGGAMSDKRTVVDFRSTSRDGLADWFALKIDGLRRMVMAGLTPAEINNTYGQIRWKAEQLAKFKGKAIVAPDAAHQLWPTSQKAIGDLTFATSKPTAKILATLKRMAAEMDNPLRGVIVDGSEKLVLWIDELVMEILKDDANFRNAFVNARERSANNPIFKDAYGEFDGLILKRVPMLLKPVTGGANNGKVRRLILAGADDMLEAWGRHEDAATDGKFGWYEDTADRGQRKSITVSGMYGISKNCWTDESDNSVAWMNSCTIDLACEA